MTDEEADELRRRVERLEHELAKLKVPPKVVVLPDPPQFTNAIAGESGQRGVFRR